MSVGAAASMLVGHLVSDSQLPLALVMTGSAILACFSCGLIRRAQSMALAADQSA